MFPSRISIYFILVSVFFFQASPAFTWGFFAHKKINQLAVFTLPPEMLSFYKYHIDYLTKHSTDADKRRHAVKGEAEKHYIDLDHYGAHPFLNIPMKWKDAVVKFSEDTLKAYGIVPWQIERMIYSLSEAFKEMNIDKILYLSANIGHYVGDAHVPLHTTENYNGQLTGQTGIHAFWESRLPELFSEKWNFFTGRARYVDDPNEEIWKIIKESFSAKDSVLKLEAELSVKWSSDKKYSYEGNHKVYSAEYSEAYQKALNGMVERRMRNAVAAVGSFWYTAWVNAGQPDLGMLLNKQISDSLQSVQKELERQGIAPRGHEDGEE